MIVRVVADDLWFPEGPVALPDGSVLVVEMRRQTLTRIAPDGRKHIVARLGGGPNGAAIGPDGHCYVCNNGGFKFETRADGSMANVGPADDYVSGRIERVDIDSGKVELLYDHADDVPLRGPNDMVFDAHGGFYFTDMGKTRRHDLDRGRVYYARADGTSINALISPISKPNGIGLSPDGATLYVAETETARVWAWPLAAPGRLAVDKALTHQSPHGGRLVFMSPQYDRLDSMAIEADGRVCVASLDQGGVWVCPPEAGAAELLPVPGDLYVTNLCFGGADLRTAYVTQSHTGRLIEMPWPRAGLRLNYSDRYRPA